jgi:hypothetical protein
MRETTGIALLVDLVGTFLAQLSLILMKQTDENSSYTSFRWFIGLLCLIVGSITHILVLPYVDLVLLSANYALSILIGLVLSVTMLNESFSVKKDSPAIVMIFTGCLITVFTANEKVEKLSLIELKGLLFSTQSCVFYVYTLCTISLAIWSYSYLK